ncbi:EscU/YscU/HrcU family type III secretion system export apparatus switch protein [Pseudomonas sp. MYb118]|uniref:EscU/YscU/HrcU family type III secretion system export apparatus switch protein n=1 Tax=Pseudomonas sp. MYb118 TaxID=1848720 RepID=UPI0034CEE5C2
MSSSASKTEKPTAKRLRDASRKGQTFKAKDLVVTCLTLCGMTYMVFNASLMDIMEAYRRIIARGFDADLQQYSATLVIVGLKALLPLLVVCVLTSAVPALLQSGFAMASEALKLNFGALNPINGLKKLFSLRTVKDTVKALLYLASFALALWIVWITQRQLLFAQLFAEVPDLFAIWGHLLLVLVLTFLVCVLLIVVLDALSEYGLFMRDQMMDKDSVKREHKEQDGDPQVKGRRRELHRELLSEQIKSDVRNSRMIIANPTHIAIGVYFQPEITVLPFISLMETNQRALAVRAYAREVGVPVINDVALARRIYRTHQRYSFLQVQEVEEVLRLLIWLEQVEQA